MLVSLLVVAAIFGGCYLHVDKKMDKEARKILWVVVGFLIFVATLKVIF